MKYSEMNGNQKIGFTQVYWASQWVVGGYENAQSDYGDPMPSHKDLADEIYYTIMNCTTGEGFQSCRPQKEVKFCGSEWLKERIEKRLAKMGY